VYLSQKQPQKTLATNHDQAQACVTSDIPDWLLLCPLGYWFLIYDFPSISLPKEHPTGMGSSENWVHQF
jgi:hypothetical protein